jgi:RNA polymerase sigma-70 factor (ECF subfamily)
MELSEHLFRRESGRLVAALVRIFGVHNLALAEDVVQDAFCRALEVWKVRGIPDNPAAWLMSVAKHRALDIVRKEKTAQTFAGELSRVLESEWTLVPTIEEAFAGSTIRDEQLRMMFSCCDPRLPEEVQVALVPQHSLRLRGERDRERISDQPRGDGETDLAREKVAGIVAASVRPRGRRVRTSAIGSQARVVSACSMRVTTARRRRRRSGTDLCREAILLTTLLLESPQTAVPETQALAALMHLQAAKLPARVDADGDLNPLVEQDRSRWDAQLVAQGLDLLDRSAAGSVISAYHVEAANRGSSRHSSQCG